MGFKFPRSLSILNHMGHLFRVQWHIKLQSFLLNPTPMLHKGFSNMETDPSGDSRFLQQLYNSIGLEHIYHTLLIYSHSQPPPILHHSFLPSNAQSYPLITHHHCSFTIQLLSIDVHIINPTIHNLLPLI